MKNLFYILISFSFFFHSACGGGGGSSSFEASVVIENISFPVRALRINDDTLLVAELSSGILYSYNTTLGQRINLFNFPAFNPNRGGISGLLVDRDYSSNSFVYVYHTSSAGRNVLTRLQIRGGSVVDSNVIGNFTQSATHNGGGMYQLEDGSILLGLGDGDRPDLVQNLSNLEGKILLLGRNGEFLDSNNGLPPGIYASGFRNPFGISGYLSESIFVADNGPECDDKIFPLISGGIYPWSSDYVCGSINENFIQPIFVWNESKGITDLIYLPSRNMLLTSLFSLNSIRGISLSSNRNSATNEEEIHSHHDPVISFSLYSENQLLYTSQSGIYFLKF